jgi:serine protease Do
MTKPFSVLAVIFTVLLAFCTVFCTADDGRSDAPKSVIVAKKEAAQNKTVIKDEISNEDIHRASRSFVDLAEQSRPAVVYIEVSKRIHLKNRSSSPFFNRNDPFRDFFERFGVPEQDRIQKGQGSGFIISDDGYIITNNHVVSSAETIKVKLLDKRSFDAELIGNDPKTDLALIKIKDPEKLPVLPMGDSDALQVGEWVMAIGNPFGLSHTVTAGIVSAKGRNIGAGNYDDFIQTDASINPGNSGGPLINVRGEVVGINTLINASGQGIGFAIPINLAKGILDQLKDTGHVTRGWLGVLIQNVTPEIASSLGLEHIEGALVSEVFADSPADDADLKPGDVIVEFMGHKVEEHDDLPIIVADTKIGSKAEVIIIRDGKRKKLTVNIAKMPDDSTQVVPVKSEEKLDMSVQDVPVEFSKKLGIKTGMGVIVMELVPGGSSDEAGIRKGDVILEVNRRPIGDVDDFLDTIKQVKKGDALLFLIKREGGSLFLAMTK